MKFAPRHLAAAQYTVIAVFAIATWLTLLSPWEEAIGQLKFMFGPSSEYRELFLWILIVNLLTTVVAITFWFKFSALYPVAHILVCVAVALFVWSVWWSNPTYIFNYALGLAFSIWSWLRANPAFKRDCRKSAAAP